MTRPMLAALLAATLLAAPSAHAGAAVDQAARAEELAGQGKFTEALAAADAAVEAIWAKAPLSFRRAVFAAAEPQGFGIYDLRETSRFRKSEPLVIYAEPTGFGYGRDGELYLIDLALDFVITGADGKEVARQENFASLSLRSRVANKEFMAKVTYDFSGLPPGDYQVTTVAHDKYSGKSGEFALKFTMTE